MYADLGEHVSKSAVPFGERIAIVHICQGWFQLRKRYDLPAIHTETEVAFGELPDHDLHIRQPLRLAVQFLTDQRRSLRRQSRYWSLAGLGKRQDGR